MRHIKIYKFKRQDGGLTVSPNKPEGEYTEGVRIIADPGKAITKDGVNFYPAKDEDSLDGWYEVDAPEEEEDGNNEIPTS
jgi:hypothetical protein